MFETKVVEEVKTHIVFNNFFSGNGAFYKIMWKNIVERVRPQMTILFMRIACWITKATNTHSEYIILIAFPLQRCCKNAPECYIIHCLCCLVFFTVKLWVWKI